MCDFYVILREHLINFSFMSFVLQDCNVLWIIISDKKITGQRDCNSTWSAHAYFIQWTKMKSHLLGWGNGYDKVMVFTKVACSVVDFIHYNDIRWIYFLFSSSAFCPFHLLSVFFIYKNMGGSNPDLLLWKSRSFFLVHFIYYSRSCRLAIFLQITKSRD